MWCVKTHVNDLKLVSWRGGRVAECGGLLNRCTSKIVPGVRIPPSPPTRVKLSIKSDYAARAVLWLSQHYAEGGARTVEEMAQDQGIPANYLVQILIELKSAQIVKSQRGKAGGYLLARPPSKITFGDVLRCIHGEIFDSPALAAPPSPPELRHAWQELRRAVNQTADAITFQQMVEASLEKGKMYYI
jgi:Rrf2 family transcriptional regulator, cysteine metabolism repressor